MPSASDSSNSSGELHGLTLATTRACADRVLTVSLALVACIPTIPRHPRHLPHPLATISRRQQRQIYWRLELQLRLRGSYVYDQDSSDEDDASSVSGSESSDDDYNNDDDVFEEPEQETNMYTN